MRNTLIIILFCTFVFSCSKDSRLENFKNQIAGKWEIEKRVCGECMSPLIIYPEGNGSIIVLLNDGTFERRIHDSVTFKGKFFLNKSDECGKPDSDISMSTNESLNSTPLFVKIESGKLQLSTPYCYADGVSTSYRRIQ
ncbi:hypothetical protein [Lacibacter sp.]|uniref:hypothetical protein n=1 Tax=Lacibacter sp. TaxID=1915409 RepID=UPI002B4ADBDB|nr:hypothetical protein [Lacibacter sp.]HLP37912.1 hypothetical protein [Lacibacter sp.]